MSTIIDAIANAYCNQTISKPEAIELLVALKAANQDQDAFITNSRVKEGSEGADEVSQKTELQIFEKKYSGSADSRQVVSRLFFGSWFTAGFDGVKEKVRLVSGNQLADFNSKSAGDFFTWLLEKKVHCPVEGRVVEVEYTETTF